MGAPATGGGGRPAIATGETATARLADILVASLKQLAQAGQADAACRLAGRACAVLRGNDPAQWRKFNALLHRLSPSVPHDTFRT